MDDPFVALGLAPLVNATGTWTLYGGAPASDEAAEATARAMAASVVMAELEAHASRAIAAATGAGAGCVTACSAAGITLAVAGVLSGADRAAVRRLPEVAHDRTEVVMLKGHVVDFGADIRQMVRLAGARVVEAGSATFCHGFELADALTERTAALLYVVSHLTSPRGMPTVPEVAALARDCGLPLIVDAAAETDLRRFHREGADLVIQSVHKFLRGPTAGLVSGRADLVAAVAAQSEGIGRTMKVGKEDIAGALAALTRWQALDHVAQNAAWEVELDAVEEGLGHLPGVTTAREADTTGNPFRRLRVTVDPERAGLDAAGLARRLRDGRRVFTRDHLAEHGYILVDPRSLGPGDAGRIAEAVRALLRPCAPPPVCDPI